MRMLNDVLSVRIGNPETESVSVGVKEFHIRKNPTLQFAIGFPSSLTVP